MRLFCLTLAVLAGLAATPAFADGKDELGKKLLERCGAKAQVNQLRPILEEFLLEPKLREKLSPEQYDTLARMMRSRFTSSSFYPVLEAAFVEAVDEKVLEDVDRWYQTPFAKKLAEVEAKAIGFEAVVELHQFEQEMESRPPPAARVKLIQRLDEATQETEWLVELTVGTVRGLARAGGAVLGSPAEANARQLKGMRDGLRPDLQQRTQVSLLFTYQSLSDQELKQYLKYLSTPSAKAFHQAIAKSLQVAFEDASAKAGKDLAEASAKKGQ
jgi:hypothetical protein